jgi:hypothetical protein
VSPRSLTSLDSDALEVIARVAYRGLAICCGVRFSGLKPRRGHVLIAAAGTKTSAPGGMSINSGQSHEAVAPPARRSGLARSVRFVIPGPSIAP